MKEKKLTIIVDGTTRLNLVLNKTKKDWNDTFGHNEDLWDFPIKELLDGTIEIDQSQYYWLIGGRCYETGVPVES